MTNEDINGLLGTVSVDLRNGWERKNLEGNSLLALRDEHYIATKEQETCRRSYRFWFGIALVVAVCAVFTAPSSKTSPNILVLYFTILLGVGSFTAFKYHNSEAEFIKRRNRVAEIENIFEQFSRSVKCLHLYDSRDYSSIHVDTKHIMDRAVSIAVRIIESERMFDRQRANKGIGRGILTNTGVRLRSHKADENLYSRTLSDDFDYEIDWTAAFKRAEDHLKQINPTS